VRVDRFADAGAFLEAAGPFLAAREAEHNLMLGLAGRLRSNPHAYGSDDPYLARVAGEGGETVAVGLRTPPHNLVLSEVDDERALDALAADVKATFAGLPGVLGPKEPTASFVRRWQALTGSRGRIAMAERIYAAGSVSWDGQVPGALRPFRDDDREVVLSWLEAFRAEAMTEPSPESGAEVLERRVADPGGGFVLWEDGEAVSVAGYGGPTPSGIRLGPVYTPPEWRRRGYAAALTAALTRMLLERGRRFVFLVTDLANPTSNGVYLRVGYRPVTDVDQWTFDQRAADDVARRGMAVP
jgi:predicted GNAT family acetyltransferase